MSFFLSSPPQPTYQKSHLQPNPQHSFFTPQTHRTTFFTDPFSGSSFQFQPKSPSPLRPSWNAGNVMRRQQCGTKGDENQGTSDGEIGAWENNADTASSPFTISHNTNESAQAASNPADTASTIPLFTSHNNQLNPHPQTQLPSQSQNSTRNPFQFQSQSNQTRPTPQLNTRIRQNRDTRRSLFLDRLRSSRRDERDNNIIEKFEKEEYWRDRKRREERMSREAEGWVGWEEEVEEDEQWDGEEDMSPVDEEREVGELVEGWYEAEIQRQGEGLGLDQSQNQTHSGPGVSADERDQNQEDDFMDAQFDFEDSDVEEAFMQVLSQQQQMQQTQRSGDVSTARVEDGDGIGHGLVSQSQDTVRDAEMS